MRRFLPLMAVAAIAAMSAGPAAAGTWIFNPSYYSHDPVQQVRIGQPQVQGGPYYSRPQGEYIRSGYRYLHSTINVGGRSHDHLNVYESWIQTGEQW